MPNHYDSDIQERVGGKRRKKKKKAKSLLDKIAETMTYPVKTGLVDGKRHGHD